MITQAFLSQAAEILSQHSPEDLGVFGDVEMGYDEMYQASYIAGKPVTFTEYCNDCREYMLDQSQEAFYLMIQEEAESLGLNYEDAAMGIVNPLVVHVVNYKGEGEGVYLYEEAKGFKTYRGKYDYC